jgi:hypothetical protein
MRNTAPRLNVMPILRYERLDNLWGRLTMGTLAFVVQNEVAAPNRQDHGQEEEASSKT